jgi:hypothetical protein
MNKTTIDQIFEVINSATNLQPHASVATIGKLNQHAAHIIDRALKGECSEGYELDNRIIEPQEMALMLSEFADTSSASLAELLDCPFCLIGIYTEIYPFHQALERFNDMVWKKQVRRHRVIDRIYKDVFNFYEITKENELKYRNKLILYLLDNKLYDLLTLDTLFKYGFSGEVKRRMQECHKFKGVAFDSDHPEEDFSAEVFFNDKELDTVLVDSFNNLHEDWKVIVKVEDNRSQDMTTLLVTHKDVIVAMTIKY